MPSNSTLSTRSTILAGAIVVVATSAIVWALSSARQRPQATGEETNDNGSASAASLERSIEAARKRHAEAEESLSQLTTKANDKRTSFTELAREVEQFLAMYGGTPASLRAAELLTNRPSLLDALDPAKIPAQMQNPWRKAGFDARRVVAVLGQRAGDNTRLNTVCFSADDARILTADSTDNTRLWDAISGKEQSVFRGNRACFVPGLWSGKQRILTLATDGILRLFDGEGKMEDELGQASTAAVNLTGEWVLMGREGGLLSLMELASRREIDQWPSRDSAVNEVAFLPNGQRVLSVGPDATLRVWQSRGNRLDRDIRGTWKQITKLVASPEGRLAYLVAGKNDGVQLIGLQNGRSVRYWETEATVSALAVSTDGRYAALVLPDGKGSYRVRVYDVNADKRVDDWSLPGPVHDLAFAHDGRHLLTANADGTAYILRR